MVPVGSNTNAHMLNNHHRQSRIMEDHTNSTPSSGSCSDSCFRCEKLLVGWRHLLIINTTIVRTVMARGRYNTHPLHVLTKRCLAPEGKQTFNKCTHLKCQCFQIVLVLQSSENETSSKMLLECFIIVSNYFTKT